MQFKSLVPIKADVYTLPYAVYEKMPKAAMEQLYKDYIILGSRQWVSPDHMVLIKRGAHPDYE
jgi:hypothetical protein